MDKNRILMILIGIGTVAVLIGGFLLGVQPSLQAAAASEEARQSALAANAANQATLDALVAQNKKVGALSGELEELRASVPASESMPSFLDSVDAAAQAEGLVVQDVTPGDPQAYAPQGASAPAAPSTSSSSSSSPTPTPTPGPTSAAPAAGTQAPAIHTDPSISAANFLAVPVKIGVEGPLTSAIAFVKRLQSGPRLFLVSGFSGGSNGGASNDASAGVPAETYAVTGYVYVLAKAAAATPAPAK
jgi:Tfp pilus assembly protein PilO